MKNKFRGFVSLSLILLIATLACNLSAGPAATQPPATGTDLPVVDNAPAATEAPAIQHTLIPPQALPSTQSGLAGDYDSSLTAAEKRAPGGDRFTFGRFERPFNASTMDVYYPYLDIQTSSFYQDELWMYGVIGLKPDDANQGLKGKYGFEVDLNVDGGGDWLVMTTQPSTTEWTTDGVEVWFDTNDDVGGTLKVLTDDISSPGDAYETMVFGHGQGEDQDLAWARISPDDPNTVEIAAKLSLLDGDAAFMVGMWAGGEDLSPTLFDVNDLYTHEEAGTALLELEFFYPIEEISELDNACRMAIGFQPSGQEPGVCPQPPDGTPEDPPPGLFCQPPEIIFCNSNGYCYCLGPQG